MGPEAPRATIRDDEECDQEDHDMIEPQMSIDPLKEVSHKRKPTWARELIRRNMVPQRGLSRRTRDLAYI